MKLVLEVRGGPVRWMAETGSPAGAFGVVGIDVAGTPVGATEQTVVQLLLDDDERDFDSSLLDTPLLAELIGADGVVVARSPFDHDEFRRTLQREHEAGESVTRGVLLVTDGQPPPPWVRLAFLPMPVAQVGPGTLVVRRTTVEELRAGVDEAHEAGAIGDEERVALLTSIDQLHPAPG